MRFELAGQVLSFITHYISKCSHNISTQTNPILGSEENSYIKPFNTLYYGTCFVWSTDVKVTEKDGFLTITLPPNATAMVLVHPHIPTIAMAFDSWQSIVSTMDITNDMFHSKTLTAEYHNVISGKLSPCESRKDYSFYEVQCWNVK
jgi:hypothetical protein